MMVVSKSPSTQHLMVVSKSPSTQHFMVVSKSPNNLHLVIVSKSLNTQTWGWLARVQTAYTWWFWARVQAPYIWWWLARIQAPNTSWWWPRVQKSNTQCWWENHQVYQNYEQLHGDSKTPFQRHLSPTGHIVWQRLFSPTCCLLGTSSRGEKYLSSTISSCRLPFSTISFSYNFNSSCTAIDSVSNLVEHSACREKQFSEIRLSDSFTLICHI